MSEILEHIVNKISEANPVSAKKLRKNYSQFSREHIDKAEDFFNLYSDYLNRIHKNIDYAVDCYLRMTGDMFYERMKFLETGEYSNKSYKSDEKIYSNSEIMDYHSMG
jgi:hypothetical protein